MNIKELRRSKEHRIIAGVCGGIAEYFETDPALVRLIFLLFTIPGGAGILAYFILWIVVPEHGDKRTIEEEVQTLKKKYMPEKHNKHGSRDVLGFILIIIGLLFLLDNLFPGFGIRTFWPLLLVFLGLAMMLHHHDHAEHREHHPES